MLNRNKDYLVKSSDANGSQYMTFDQIDIYFDSSITPKTLNFLRNMAKDEHTILEFVDGSSSKVTKLTDNYPKWTVA